MNSFVDQSLVWARRTSNEIYWPGRILGQHHDTLTTTSKNYYQIQLFINQQTMWTDDVLPYGQYRESMTNNSFIQYNLHPTIKQEFFNAVQQADFALNQTMMINPVDNTYLSNKDEGFLSMIEDKTENDFLSTPTQLFHSETDVGDLSASLLSTFDPLPIDATTDPSSSTILTTHDDWYSQQNAFFESITPPLPSDIEQPATTFISPILQFQQTTAVFIVTNRNYSSPSFLSYLHHSLSSFTYRSVHYIDPIATNNNTPPQPFPPTVSNIIYLICFDQCSTTIEQIIDTTILHNLHPHLTYYFVLLNIPSQSLVNHLYDNVMDKRSILIVQYYSSFDESSLLVCSGDRQTFDTLAEPFLKCLSVKIKYIEPPTSKDPRFYSASSIASILHTGNAIQQFLHQQIQQTINERFPIELREENGEIFDELFPSVGKGKTRTNDPVIELIEREKNEWKNKATDQRQQLHDLFPNGTIRQPMCDYYLHDLLDKR